MVLRAEVISEELREHINTVDCGQAHESPFSVTHVWAGIHLPAILPVLVA